MSTALLKKLGRRLRLGMVGGGFDSIIGETHRMAFSVDGLYELVAGAFSIDPAMAEETGRTLLVAPDRIYADYKDMARKEAERSDGIDVVVIATPPNIHAEVAIVFLRNGIDVICEKPLTRTLAQALALQTAVKSSGRVFVVTYCYSGFPMVRHARDLVASGALGPIKMIEAEFAGGAPGVAVEPDDPAKRHWRFRAGTAGREALLGEVGSHIYHMIGYVSGMTPRRLSARMQTFARNREVYDNAYLDFDYQGGAVGRMWSSYVATGSQHGLSFRIYGEDASVEWHEEHAEYLRFKPFDAPEMLFRAGQNGMSDFVSRSARFRPGHPEGYPLAFANIYVEAAHAIAALKHKESPQAWLDNLPGVEAGVAGIRMIEAAAASNADDGAWQRLDGGSAQGG